MIRTQILILFAALLFSACAAPHTTKNTGLPSLASLAASACEEDAAQEAMARIECLEQWLIDYGTDPGAAPVQYALANAWIVAGNPGRARQVIQDLLQKDPKNRLAAALLEGLKQGAVVAWYEPVTAETTAPAAVSDSVPASIPRTRPKPALYPEPVLYVRIPAAAVLAIQVEQGRLVQNHSTDTLDTGLHRVNTGGRWECIACRWRVGDFEGDTTIRWLPAQQVWVAELPIERYLEGVVGAEMATGWPMEALRAQAIVSRTYAWSVFAWQDEEAAITVLEPSTRHQVYRPESAAPDIVRAVQSTRGQVLLYERRPIVAYFHADNGGMSELPRYVWGDDFPYFQAVTDPFSNVVKAWQWQIDAGELHRLLQRKLLQKGESLSRIRLQRHAGGRVHRAVLETNRRSLTVKGNDLRLLLGPTKLRSLWFRVGAHDGTYTFRGHGYGHGVGMSQWGARKRAEQGRRYPGILAAYYPGTRLARAW